MLELSLEDIYPSLSDILLAKKWQNLKKSPLAIHIATEAKKGKQIAGTISYVIACKLVTSLRTHCFAILSSLWTAKSQIFLLVTLFALRSFEK